MSGVFSAENAEVEIYHDDGTGSPDGSALMTLRFKTAIALASDYAVEEILHAGYPDVELSLGGGRHTLNLEKMVESRSNDLRLSNALYYVRVICRTDDYSAWDRYNCKKCRRTSWDLRAGDTGPVVARGSFICERIDSEAVA